jgi:hypothetical protein
VTLGTARQGSGKGNVALLDIEPLGSNFSGESFKILNFRSFPHQNITHVVQDLTGLRHTAAHLDQHSTVDVAFISDGPREHV